MIQSSVSAYQKSLVVKSLVGCKISVSDGGGGGSCKISALLDQLIRIKQFKKVN